MLTSFIKSLLPSLRGWLRDEPPRWDEAALRAEILALENNLMAAEGKRDEALDRLDACGRTLADHSAAWEADVRKVEVLTGQVASLRADLASARKATDALDVRLRATLDELHDMEDRARKSEDAAAAFAAVMKVIDDYREMTRGDSDES